MTRRSLVGIAALLALSIATVAIAEEGATKEKAPHSKHAMSKMATTWTADDMKWESMPGIDGVQIATLWGDMNKGAYGAIVKLPPNQPHPLHTHTAMCKVVIISGAFLYTPEGGTEKSYGPGSYLMIPGGLKHTSGSGPDGVTMFQESPGKWDLKPVNGPVSAQ